MQPIRLGVIGAGLIWLRRHQSTLATLQHAFMPVAFADPSEQRRTQAAADFPDAVVVSDYQALLALPQVDAVLVLTPIVLNAPVALAALHAGKDVIMEKPIARSVAEAAHLLTQAKEAGRRLAVLEQMGYRRAEEILAETIASGEIGNLALWERVEHMEGDEWMPDTAGGREAINDALSNWNAFSNSSPREGILAAIETFYDPAKKISLYVYSDDFSSGSINAVVREVDRRNSAGADGKRRVRIHAVAFPVYYEVTNGELLSSARFAILMRELCQRNGGTFVALPSLRG
jgi:hypothetical protein